MEQQDLSAVVLASADTPCRCVASWPSRRDLRTDRPLQADLTARLEALTPEEYLDLERRLGPRSSDVEFGDAWDQVAGATLQDRAVEQLTGSIAEQAAQLAGQLTRARVDQASRHFDNRRLLHRLNSLQQPQRDLGRDLGRDGLDRGLSL